MRAYPSPFFLIIRLSVLGIAILGNPAGVRATTIFTVTSAGADWGPNTNGWSFSGPGFQFSGEGDSYPSAFIFMFPGNILQPFSGGFSGYTAEYRGPQAINYGTFTIDGITYTAGSPLNEFCSDGVLNCASISASADLSANFTVPVGPAVITVPAVLSGSGDAISCVGLPSRCPTITDATTNATILISVPGELTITVGPPSVEFGVYAEGFTADFSGSLPEVPEPGAMILLVTGLVLLAGYARVFRRACATRAA